MSFEILDEHSVSFEKDMKRFSLKEQQGYIDEIEIADELILLKSDLSLKQTCDFHIKSNAKHLIFTFLLDGSNTYQSGKYSNIFTQKDFFTVSIDNSSSGLKTYHKNQSLKSIQLILGEKYLNTILHGHIKEHEIMKRYYQNEHFWQWIKTDKINPLSKINLINVFNTPFCEDFNSLFVHSKVLELLQIELTSLFLENKGENKVKFSEFDKQALETAKNILQNNFQNPPTISKLSRMTHLNEFKLKRGFREFFHTTIYGLVLKYRMQEAKVLLQQSDLNIDEIAKKVGYKHTCNFSSAFKKYYNINAKEVMKKRKYYY